MRRSTSDRPTTIYTLSAGPGLPPRYVGKTVARLEKRLCNHVGDSRRNPRWPVQRWVRSLLDDGAEPIIEALEVVPPGEDWEEAERHWICVLRSYGCDLLNLSPGGEGTTGYKYTAEQRHRLRIAHAGQRRTPEVIEKWRAAMEKKRAAGWRPALPADITVKARAARRRLYESGVRWPRAPLTEEQRRRISEARRAADSPEYRARMSASKKGKRLGPPSPQHRAAISAAKRRKRAAQAA